MIVKWLWSHGMGCMLFFTPPLISISVLLKAPFRHAEKDIFINISLYRGYIISWIPRQGCVCQEQHTEQLSGCAGVFSEAFKTPKCEEEWQRHNEIWHSQGILMWMCVPENILFALSSLHHWLRHLCKWCLWICPLIIPAEVPFYPLSPPATLC